MESSTQVLGMELGTLGLQWRGRGEAANLVSRKSRAGREGVCLERRREGGALDEMVVRREQEGGETWVMIRGAREEREEKGGQRGGGVLLEG